MAVVDRFWHKPKTEKNRAQHIQHLEDCICLDVILLVTKQFRTFSYRFHLQLYIARYGISQPTITTTTAVVVITQTNP